LGVQGRNRRQNFTEGGVPIWEGVKNGMGREEAYAYKYQKRGFRRKRERKSKKAYYLS